MSYRSNGDLRWKLFPFKRSLFTPDCLGLYLQSGEGSSKELQELLDLLGEMEAKHSLLPGSRSCLSAGLTETGGIEG